MQVLYCGHGSVFQGDSQSVEPSIYETDEYLFDHGKIQSKDGVAKWLTSAVGDSKSCIVLDSCPTTPSRSFIAHQLFEKQKLDQIQFISKTFCCLKEFQLGSGVVLRSGDSSTEIVVYQNNIPISQKSYSFGGKQISQLFYDLLPKQQKQTEPLE